ncbi:MAG: hypothetical protein M3Y33_20815 [Actinomycetota bacterium]|nr:hypothetical protein [Actinomycetota bacterium]
MTTTRVPLDEIFAGRPDSADGGSRLPRRLRRGWLGTGRREPADVVGWGLLHDRAGLGLLPRP